MTLKFKTQYLDAVRGRYFNSSKKEKSQILNELCSVTGYSRKHAIKALSNGHKKGKKLSGRTKTYSRESIYHLKRLWHILGRICSKKMVSALPTWIKYYENEGFNEALREEILSMSAATIDRYLKTHKAQFASRRRTGTRRSKAFKNVIPIKDLDHKASRPGYIQADTVAHCGDSLSGVFVWTMTVTDEHTGWTENRAMHGKNGDNSVEAICSAFGRFPFHPIEFNSDNGTEFLNAQLHKYIFGSQGIRFTRSRPYRKNDNAHVEQKNNTHVREIFGYDRIERKELVPYMNEIYKNYFNVIHNFFVPQLKCIEKKRIGAKYIRKYGKPKTPYERVLESPHITQIQKTRLRARYENLNPIQLRKDFNRLMNRFKDLKRAEEIPYKWAA